MNLTIIDILEILVIVVLIVLLLTITIWLSLRIARLEDHQDDGPSHADLAAIRERLAVMSGHMGAMADRQNAATSAIETIQKHLLEADR